MIYSLSSLKQYIDNANVVITASGSTIYEVLAQRSTPIIFSLADNQDLIYNYLKEQGFFYLGKYPNIEYYKLNHKIKKSWNNKFDSTNIYNNIDGRGVYKLIEVLCDFLN